MNGTLTAVPTDTTTPKARGGRWWRMVPIEAKLLLRRRTTLLGLLSGPVIMIGFGVLQHPSTPAGWGVLVGTAALIGLLLTVYTTAATVFTLRRESGALSRLRTTELTGPGIVAAAGTPLLIAGVLQALLVGGVYVAVGAPFPANPLLLVAALLLGGVFCVAAGALTATVSRSAEGAQYTVMPLLLVSAAATAVLATGALPDAVNGALLFVPGVPVGDLVTRAWAGTAAAPDVAGVPAAAIGPVMLVVWTVIAAFVAAKRWRWTPRG